LDDSVFIDDKRRSFAYALHAGCKFFNFYSGRTEDFYLPESLNQPKLRVVVFFLPTKKENQSKYLRPYNFNRVQATVLSRASQSRTVHTPVSTGGKINQHVFLF
jgi:hypothetical protein